MIYIEIKYTKTCLLVQHSDLDDDVRTKSTCFSQQHVIIEHPRYISK